MAQPIGTLSRTYRHMGRYRQILTVLARYGFGEVLGRLRVEHYLEIGLKVLGAARPKAETRSRAERVRLALGELGPTFIKIGQLLSTRPDLVPLDVLRELERLQDQAPAIPGAEARAIVERELGRELGSVFARFDETPIAAASLGQVHRAALVDGTPVAVKVLRPGIRRTVETDLEILEHLAALAERHLEEMQVVRPTALVEELRRALLKELDYTIEAAHLRRFARMFEADPSVRVPRVYREWTTARVLTMEHLDGIKVTDAPALERGGHDREAVARNGARALLEQVFVHGFFHADPHPGNVLVLPGDVIGFVDLGQIGRLDREHRALVSELLRALVTRDHEDVVESLLTLTAGDDPLDRQAFEIDVAEFLDWHLDRPVGELQFGRMLLRLLEVLGRHRRTIPPDLFLVLKALGTVESLARALAPSFDLASCARPVLERVARERLAPRRLAREVWTSSSEMLRLAREIPAELRQILGLVRRGRLHVEFQHEGLDPLLHAHELAINRLVFAIVLASLLIGSSLVTLGDFPFRWRGIPIIGLVGYLLAGVLGLGLLWSIFRRGRL